MTSIMQSMFDSIYDSSFHGFTSQDIYNNDIFEVIRNKDPPPSETKMKWTS